MKPIPLRYLIALFLLILTTNTGWSQQSDIPASVREQDPADEIGKLKKNCFHHMMGCAEVLFTGQPVHIAVGTIAPQNGVAGGFAFVHHKTLTNWLINSNSDAVASGNGSWRAGVYIKLVDTRQPDIAPVMGTQGSDTNPTELPEQPVINIYAQTISLNQISYFGLGETSQESGRTFYGMRETIAGISGVRTIYHPAHISLYGEINGRWTSIRGRYGQSSPSIEQVYNETTAPGLSNQPGFLQPGIGLRILPSFRNDLFHLNYDVAYRPYFAVSDSRFSFQRFTANLSHQISLYRNVIRTELPRETNGPDDCSTDPAAEHPSCPKATTRNLEGSLGVTLFTTLSTTQGSGVVPFYFQPTLGGADINGNPSLSSYQDYRFRAPNLLLIRENFEHSIWKLPVGFVLLADQGKLALTPTGLGPAGWRHSFATGLTLRAGGFPQVYLMFAWGGKEGTHFLANINSSLLGASPRPSLF